MAKYNGHKNYNAWNVSLWLNNDEGLYLLMLDSMRRRSKDEAAQILLDTLNDIGIFTTPDGVRYTYTNIRKAMRE